MKNLDAKILTTPEQSYNTKRVLNSKICLTIAKIADAKYITADALIAMKNCISLTSITSKVCHYLMKILSL